MTYELGWRGEKSGILEVSHECVSEFEHLNSIKKFTLAWLKNPVF